MFFLVWHLRYHNNDRSKPSFCQQSISVPTLPYMWSKQKITVLWLIVCRLNMKEVLRENLPRLRGKPGLVQSSLCNLPVAGVALLPRRSQWLGTTDVCVPCHSVTALTFGGVLSASSSQVCPRKAWFSEVTWFILDLKSAIQPSYWQARSGLDQELANFFCKGPNSKYFQLCGNTASVTTIQFCSCSV